MIALQEKNNSEVCPLIWNLKKNKKKKNYCIALNYVLLVINVCENVIKNKQTIQPIFINGSSCGVTN